MNNRRRLVIVLGASALAAPFDSFAQQQGKVWRVGFLSVRHMEFVDTDYYYGPFRQGMQKLGYVEGKNLIIEWRSAEGKDERLPELAVELVRWKPDVLITAATPAARAAQKATTTIPIVIINVGEPVADGLVKSLVRPGGNSTGFSNMNVELVPKLVQMLHDTVPKTTRVAVLANGNMPKDYQALAQKLGIILLPIEASTPQAIANGFAEMTRQKAEALVVLRDAFLNQQKSQIVALATRQRLPSIGGYSDYAEAGGLMSYGQNIRENAWRAATYVDKIFKGAKVGDLPVQRPTIFEFVLNLKTAKALGITMPQTILVQATKVIE